MTKSKSNKKVISKTFKEKIAISFKNYGLKIPTTDEEVELFEKIYGTTDFDLSEELGDSNSILEWGGKLYSSSTILSMCAEDLAVYGRKNSTKKKEKVIPLKQELKKKGNRADYFKNVVLAAEIANELYSEPTFGHKKFVKVKYLCEKICKMKLESNYGKYAAGPLDPKSMYSIDAEFKRQKWFNVEKRKGSYGYKYTPLEKVENYKQYYSRYYANHIDSIKRIIELFRKETSDFCEKVATLFYVWKENLENDFPIDEYNLFKEFYAWDDSKKRFRKSELSNAIKWMKENKIIPGKGININ